MTSKETKHTEGPWAVNPRFARVDAFNSGKAVPVCKLLWPTEERSESETEANARLIACAPDLLEMARLFERAIAYDIRRSEADGDDEAARLKTVTLSLVRAAIAKAQP